MSIYTDRIIAAEISALTRYYDRLIQWRPLPFDSGDLFSQISCREKTKLRVDEPIPDLSAERAQRTLVLLNGNLNHSLDVQSLLMELRPRLSRTSRVGIVAYNPYARWVYRVANALGLRRGDPPANFVTATDLQNIAKLSDLEVVRIRPAVYIPFALLGLGTLLNALLAALPIVRWLGLVNVIILRALVRPEERPSLSVVVPARNERGNIEQVLQRMPRLDAAMLEIIFVEGHSTDGTWEEVQRVAREYGNRHTLKTLQQTGKGKNDAVRLGFANATGDVLTILDADLSMPPELLGRFYDAYRAGTADFVNGNRLVYPMEGGAMRFLNRLGNIFFAKALSSVLGTRIGDSLCGTKLCARHDYERIVRWRNDFGDFDPFGDFELLFPAAVLGLAVVDVPIAYRARTYGTTNISRFRHGWMLLRMTIIGFFRIKMGRVR
jgi:hypothetical protein